VDYDSGALNCTPASGSTFPLGQTTVTCTDVGENPADSFKVNVVDTTPPEVTVPGPITAEATGPAGAAVSFSATAADLVDAAPAVSCTSASGATFPLGTTTVSCTATDASNNTSAPATFTVSVVDTTPPVITTPGNISATTGDPAGTPVTYGPVTATDAVASVTPACSPQSGSTFAVGSTTVTCSANDGSNTATATFTITVNLADATPPTLSLPGPIVADALGPAGAVVTFSVTATDAIDPSPSVSCDRSSGQMFPLGTTTVSCTATDASNNTSAPGTFTVSVVDREAPTVETPGTITVEATSPSGAAATFSVTAADAVDPSPTISCDKSSGDTFPVGTTQVSCTAKDASNNTSAQAVFAVNVTDTTAPQLQNMPAEITAEANGPTGSKVNYASPTAIDIVDGPMPNVACAPASGSTFHLDVNTVTCSSSDSRGNRGSATFRINIVDTTPPVIIPPGDTSVYAATDSGSYANDQGPISAFLQGAHTSDIADRDPVITSDHPDFFGVGTTNVTFTARDTSGNVASATAKLTVLPKPVQGTAPAPPPLPPPRDNKPPANVTGVTAKSGDARVTLSWTNPTDSDFDHTEISRTTTQTGFKATGTVVYSGKSTTYTDRGLRNGVEYRYVIATVDKTGNASAGVATTVMPKANLLRTPTDGARLTKVPKQFRWKADPRAAYYNLQLYSGDPLVAQSTASTGQKILSVFPTKAVYNFKSPWKWEGRKYKMANGLYTWYVWPGYGPREDVNYGPLMGSATFQVTLAKSR
jgi:HYR domain